MPNESKINYWWSFEKRSLTVLNVQELFWKLQTSNTIHGEEEEEYERFFLKRKEKSMHGKHEKPSHVWPMHREYVAITWRESRFTLNVMGRKSQGMKRRPAKKDFPYSYACPNKGWQRNKKGNWRIAIKWSSVLTNHPC